MNLLLEKCVRDAYILKLFYTAVMLLLIEVPVNASVFKCTSNGKTIYSQIPCSQNKSQVSELQLSKESTPQSSKESVKIQRNIRSKELKNSLYVEAIDERIYLNNSIARLNDFMGAELQTIKDEKKNITIYEAEKPSVTVTYLDGSKKSIKQKKRIKRFHKARKKKIKSCNKTIKKSRKEISRLKSKIRKKERQLKRLNKKIEKLVGNNR